MYDAICFDMDGVLLDRHPEYPEPYREAVAAAFEEHGVEAAEADLDPFYGGSSKTVEDMRRVCERHGLDFEAFWPERERQCSAFQCDLLGAERVLFEDCSVLPELAADHALGVVSNNQQATVDAVLEQFEADGVALAALVETAYGREPSVEGYQRRKPEPHYLERALADLGTDAALYVGDRESDVIVAHRAGLDSAFLDRDGDRSDALTETPTYEIERLTELRGIV